MRVFFFIFHNVYNVRTCMCTLSDATLKITHPLLQIAFQVLEIIQTHTSIDLFNPELEKEKQKRTADPVTTDLLGALLSVRSLNLSQCGKYKSFPSIGFFVKLSFMSREHEKLSFNYFS